jgi:hypothetical protein
MESSMRGVKTAVLAIVALVAVAGCAIKEIPYDRETAGGITRVGVVTPRLPSGPMINLATSPAQSFGLIGALVHVGVQADREARFETILKGQNFSVEDALVQSITAALQAQGYAVSLVPVKRDKSDFVATYPTDHGDKVDAYLDLVAVNYGYLSAGIASDSPWRPSYVLRVLLVRAQDYAVLMQGTLVYNPFGAPKEVVTIAPDPAYQYANFDTLEKDPSGAVKGLRVAFEHGAKTLGGMLK